MQALTAPVGKRLKRFPQFSNAAPDRRQFHPQYRSETQFTARQYHRGGEGDGKPGNNQFHWIRPSEFLDEKSIFGFQNVIINDVQIAIRSGGIETTCDGEATVYDDRCLQRFVWIMPLLERAVVDSMEKRKFCQ